MLQPETHRDVVRDRHSDLLRSARSGELATRLGESRREERRTFLARLPRPGDGRSAAPATSP